MENFKLTKKIAKNIAEKSWGNGGTESYPCNREGVYYFSCSGHGGYVVDGNSLTLSEKEKILLYNQPEKLNLLIQNKEIKAISYYNFYNCLPRKNRKFKVDSRFPFHWYNHDIYLFEEDCAYSILEAYTDIRRIDSWSLENFDYQEVLKTLDRWYINTQWMRKTS